MAHPWQYRARSFKQCPSLRTLACLASLFLGGCASMGPATISRDHLDYISSMSDSWKRQTLINLVKVRYADAPVFLNIESVINSYSWEAELSLSGQVARNDRSLGLGNTGRYSDRPTITYSPLSGEKFTQTMLSPFPMSAILSLLQSGYRPDIVLRACVSRINGLDNAYGSPGDPRPGSAQFQEVLTTIRKAQAAGRIDIHAKLANEKKTMVMVFLPSSDPEEAALGRKTRKLLGLDPQASEFEVVQGAFASSPREVAILARSMQQVLVDFASYIEVPAADVAEGRVYAPSRNADQLRMYPPPLYIHSGDASPHDAYVAVRYRGHWFWIDDRDVQSKTVFNFLLLMFSLTETGGERGTPVLTVPTR